MRNSLKHLLKHYAPLLARMRNDVKYASEREKQKRCKKKMSTIEDTFLSYNLTLRKKVMRIYDVAAAIS